LKDLRYKFPYISGLMVLAQNGITSFVDARNFYRRGNNEAFEQAENNNVLTSRY
jgi:hypothetical protein